MNNILKQTITGIFYLGPLIFAAGFLWPLFAQIMEKAGWTPLGLTPLLAGFLLAACLGLAAQIRGRWI